MAVCLRKLILACSAGIAMLLVNPPAGAVSNNFKAAGDIYFSGETEAGIAMIDNARAPAALFPCINCHGERAQGRKEAGVVAPNISLHQLLRAYRADMRGGSPRAPYNAMTFRRVLADGVNSNGKSLDSKMPRYVLTDQEADSLFLFLGMLHELPVQGVSENIIRVGVRLPKDETLSKALRATVKIYSEKLNTSRGIYNRSLEFIELKEDGNIEPVFCVVDLDLAYQAATASGKIEISVFSKLSAVNRGYALYRHPFEYTQMSEQLAEQQSWKLVPVTADNIVRQLVDHEKPDRHPAKLTVLQVDSRGVDVPAFFKLLQSRGVHKKVLLMNYSVSPLDPSIKKYPGDVFVLRPPGLESVSDYGRTTLINYLDFDHSGRLQTNQIPARLWALAALSLLTHSLENAGDDLTEDRFEKALQQQIDFDSSFGPSLSYSASKRVGNLGILAVKQN